MEFLFTASIDEKKGKDKSICHQSSFSILPLSSRKAVKEEPANFPQKKASLIAFSAETGLSETMLGQG